MDGVQQEATLQNTVARLRDFVDAVEEILGKSDNRPIGRGPDGNKIGPTQNAEQKMDAVVVQLGEIASRISDIADRLRVIQRRVG